MPMLSPPDGLPSMMGDVAIGALKQEAAGF